MAPTGPILSVIILKPGGNIFLCLYKKLSEEHCPFTSKHYSRINSRNISSLFIASTVIILYWGQKIYITIHLNVNR